MCATLVSNRGGDLSPAWALSPSRPAGIDHLPQGGGGLPAGRAQPDARDAQLDPVTARFPHIWEECRQDRPDELTVHDEERQGQLGHTRSPVQTPRYRLWPGPTVPWA